MTTQTESKANAFEGRNLVYFFLIVYGLQALAYGLLIAGVIQRPAAGSGGLLDDPFFILRTLGSWGPLIAAFAVTALTAGKPGVRALWGRFWNRNLSLKWLLVTLLTLPAIQLVANLTGRLLDGKDYLLFLTYNPPWSFLTQFAMAFFANGVLEEFGWRGFVLPRFQVRWNALVSSLVLGVLWALWHAGQWFVPGSSLYGRNLWQWGLGTVLLTVLLTWIFNNTKGSVLAACLFHATINVGLIWFQLDWRYYGIELMVVILIVILFGPRSLVRQQAAA